MIGNYKTIDIQISFETAFVTKCGNCFIWTYMLPLKNNGLKLMTLRTICAYQILTSWFSLCHCNCTCVRVNSNKVKMCITKWIFRTTWIFYIFKTSSSASCTLHPTYFPSFPILYLFRIATIRMHILLHTINKNVPRTNITPYFLSLQGAI